MPRQKTFIQSKTKHKNLIQRPNKSKKIVKPKITKKKTTRKKAKTE